MKKTVLVLVVSLCPLCGFTLNAQSGAGLDFSAEVSKTENTTTEQQAKIDSAFAAMEEVQESDNYVKSLKELVIDGIIPLPIGIKGGNGGYELIVHKIKNGGDGRNVIYATCAFSFKDATNDKNSRIAFEGWAEISGQKGLGNTGKLTLIAPVQRKIGNHSAIIIREGTQVTFGCGGIESFDAKLAWLITSDKIIPVNANGEQQSGQPIGVAFDAHFDDFDSYIVSLDIDQYFTFKGLDDVVFGIKGVTLDQSDVENSALTKFPPDYFGANTEADPELKKLWKGVSIAEASVALPSFFKRGNVGSQDQPSQTDRIKLSLTNALFDDNGFTGSVSAEDIIPSYTLPPHEWNISVSDLKISLLKNKVSEFALSGFLNIPPFGTHSLLPYSTSYNFLTEQFEFKVNVAGTYNFPALYSTLTLNELSSIEIQYKNKGLYPSINAHGKITINAPLTEKDSTKKFSVPDITFENLRISREAPYFEIGAIGITGNLRSPNMGGFEVGIGDIYSFNTPEGSGLGFTGLFSGSQKLCQEH